MLGKKGSRLQKVLSVTFCGCNEYAVQTVYYIVAECPNRKFTGGINDANSYATYWLMFLDINI